MVLNFFKFSLKMFYNAYLKFTSVDIRYEFASRLIRSSRCTYRYKKIYTQYDILQTYPYLQLCQGQNLFADMKLKIDFLSYVIL